MADEGQGYSAWLGGYAKSVGSIAGSVSSFTKDILEEQRQDVQDVHSQLKLSVEQIEQLQNRLRGQEEEIDRLKGQVLESRESKEVSELQIQELGSRWKLILQEKEDEALLLKNQVTDLEREGRQRANSPAPSMGRRRNMSEGFDYSDPFECEVEITRLAAENKRLSDQLTLHTTQANEVANVGSEDLGLKLKSVRSELQSVHTEHQNELAARDYSRVQELEQLRVHYEGLLTDAGGQPALLNTTVREAELHSDTVSELHANTELDAVRELQGNVKQLQEKLSEANSQRKRQQAYLAQVEEERDTINTQLNTSQQELTESRHANTELSTHLEKQLKEVAESREETVTLHSQYKELEKVLKLRDATTASEEESAERIAQFQQLVSDKVHIVSQLQVQLNGTQLQLSNRDREINQLRIALNNVNDENFQEIRASADSLKTQVEGYKDSLREAGHQLLNSNERCVTLSEELLNLKEQIKRAEERIEQMTEQIASLEQTNTDLTKKSTTLRTSHSALQSQLSDLTLTSHTLSESNTVLETLSNKLKADNLSLVLDNKRLSEAVSDNNASLRTMSEQQHMISESTQSVLEQVSTESCNESCNDTVSLSESQLEQIRSGMAVTDSLHYERLESELRDKLSVVASLEEEVQLGKERLKEVEKIAEERDRLKDIFLKSSQNRREELEKEVECGQGKLQQLRGEYEVLRGECEVLRGECEVLKAGNDSELQIQYDQLVTSAKKEKERLVSEISRIMGEMGEVEELYGATVAKLDTLEEQVGSNEVKISALSEEKERGENKMEKMGENLKKVLGRLSVKETKIDELSSEVQRLEQQLKGSQEQVLHFRDNMTDEIKAAQLGLEVPLTNVPQFSSHKADEVSEEMVTLRNKLSDSEKICLSLIEKSKDKDLKLELLKSELASLTEEAASFSSAHASNLIDKYSAATNKVTGLKEERDNLKQQQIDLTHQRDFYKDQTLQYHASMEELRGEANKRIGEASEREGKVLGDLERLQRHCMQIEVQHTQDLVESAERETELNKELQGLRESLQSANTALHSLRSDTLEESGGLHEQLYTISSQRDEAVLGLSALEDRALLAESSLGNLQHVLEQFQREKESYAEEVKEQYRRDLSNLTNQLNTAKGSIDCLQVRAAESTALEQDIENTKAQLSQKEDRIKSLKGEVSKLDVALKIAQEGLRKSMSSSDEKVDKSLIKNFFTQYVTVSEDRRQDVLKVISAILGYTEEELREIELTRQHNGKWLPTIFAKSKQQAPPIGESFSELFVSFLETEANKAALPPRARHTSQQNRPVSTPPVMGHTRTSSTSSVGSPIRASPIRASSPGSVKAATKSNRRSPAITASGSSSGPSDAMIMSTSPPPVTSVSGIAPPLVPSSLADLLSTKQT